MISLAGSSSSSSGPEKFFRPSRKRITSFFLSFLPKVFFSPPFFILLAAWKKGLKCVLSSFLLSVLLLPPWKGVLRGPIRRNNLIGKRGKTLYFQNFPFSPSISLECFFSLSGIVTQGDFPPLSSYLPTLPSFLMCQNK